MLPVMLFGENESRMQDIGKCIMQSANVPLRNIAITADVFSCTLPALSMPSIVLLDVSPLVMTNVADYVKRLKMSYHDSAVLVLLPFGEDDAANKVVEAGADDVLMRPVSVQRLALTLRNLSDLVTMRVFKGNHSSYMGNHYGASGMVSVLDEMGDLRRLHHIEQDIIQYAVSYYNGHISQAARGLGIGRSTLYRKLDAIKTRAKFSQRIAEKSSQLLSLAKT